ncbi:hypothetical protein [Patulibacter sp.]|uniref:hypothetical protein n=1 Tax=Patulibacter sp. TaxID=1912859 RepID=UPI00272013E7|nr:hypothetical protein [Patulibacter sp.]MDO9410165.1 hypothetical protein [Patulibacter sp.]
MRPEDALAHARRLAGEHAGTTIPAGGLEVERSDQPSDDQLVQWAVIEPDLREVRSTRAGPVGKAVTAVKQGQLRLLGQYHAQVQSVQNRLNVHLSLRSTLMREEIQAMKAEIRGLHARVEELEARAGVQPPADPVGPPQTFGDPLPEAPSPVNPDPGAPSDPFAVATDLAQGGRPAHGDHATAGSAGATTAGTAAGSGPEDGAR